MKQKRFTRNIRDEQDYCAFEVKDCPYQSIYDFEEYEDIENEVDCDLTLAIDKLGEHEDIEEKIKCDFLTLNRVSKIGKIYSTWKKDYMDVVNIVIWEESTRPYMTCVWIDKKGKDHTKIIFIDQYLETWAVTKEELELK